MSLSRTLLWRGLLGVTIGVIAVAWPGITVGAFVVLFAFYAFLAGGSDLAHAFSSDRVGPVVGYVLLASLSFVTGVLAIAWPGITALVLTIWVAAWALLVGGLEFYLAFQRGEIAGERAMWLIGGLACMALGLVLLVRPDTGAVTLASVFGLFAIVYGISALVLAGRVRAAMR
jgi:uncharacterized membrane protein HdeD (DUF308 family)